MDFPMSVPLTVVFDLDGTLVDTAPDVIWTLNTILEQEGLRPYAVSDARRLVGGGARLLLQKGYEFNGKTVESDKLDFLFDEFLRIYAGHIAVDSYPYEGVEVALDVLLAAGHTLAVCTNKMTYHSTLLLTEMKLLDKFSAICGKDKFPYCKPDARHLLDAIALAGGVAERAIMVGDSITDVKTAQNAGIPVICVPFGYSEQPVETLKADVIIQHFHELEAAIHTLQAARKTASQKQAIS
jgi:phosphoglycolate phosphatase